MSTRDRVQQLIDFVEQGRFVEAIKTFYAEDASTQENNDPPRTGLAVLVEKEQSFLARIKSIRALPGTVLLVDGDRATIYWIFEFVDANGQKFRLEEIALQRWRGDKIIQERYFYDPAQMRKAIS